MGGSPISLVWYFLDLKSLLKSALLRKCFPVSYHFPAYVLDPSQLTSKNLTLNMLAGGNSKCNWGTDIGVLMQQATALGHTGEKERC